MSNNNIALSYHQLVIKGDFENFKTQIVTNNKLQSSSSSSSPPPSPSPSTEEIKQVISEHRVDDNITLSLMHVAAKAGSVTMIKEFILVEPRLLLNRIIEEENKGDSNAINKYDLPIHTALKAGQIEAVNELISEKFITEQLNEVDNDNEKNTALHLALEKHYKELSESLFDKCKDTIFKLNAIGMCPLYLAINAGFFDLANKMIKHISGSSQNDKLVKEAFQSGKSIFHAAVMANNQGILSQLIIEYPNYIELFDDQDRTILSYAAEIGFVDGVKHLLKTKPELAYIRDRDRIESYPVHKACSGGNVEVVRAFYDKMTVNVVNRLRNSKNQNILHYAAMSGQDEIVKYLLENTTITTKELINMKDDDGYTPLHLATKGRHPNPKVVYRLAKHAEVIRELQDNRGLTALDLAEEEEHPEQVPSMNKRLTWMVLLYSNVPRSPAKEEQRKYTKNNISNNAPEVPYKDRLEGILLVSILIATVAFSATFTIPGGYVDGDSTNGDEGMAILATKVGFKVFVITNTLAMFSSIISAVVLIWAHLNDTKLLLVCFKVSLLFLAIALAMMSISVMTSLHVVLHTKCKWLSILIC